MSVQSCRTSFMLLLALTLYTNAARISKGFGESTSPDQHKFPVLEVVKSIEQPDTNFTGVFHSEYSVSTDAAHEMSEEDEQLYLSWEIAWPMTGKRVDQFVRFLDETKIISSTPHKTEGGQSSFKELLLSNIVKSRASKRREKRKIFGLFDSRFFIPSRSYGRRFPFSSVVKLSTGCTGTLVSPKHVLTAAHCMHDQSDYVSGFKNLKVAVQQFAAGNLRRKLKWIAVNNTFLPNGWLMGNPDVASKFDYGLLELNELHNKPFFELGISEGDSKIRIHFTAYEDDKPAYTLWYRKCVVLESDDHVLYHQCDAMPGSSGAGVYTWVRDAARQHWKRKLIGVFSGNRWRYYKEWHKRATNFNAAIRLNTLKYTQICGWMGDYAAKSCKELKANSTK